jgi:hypothetical protein
VRYAIGCGLPAMTAVTIYSVEGLAGLGRRLLLGVLADRLDCPSRKLVAHSETEWPFISVHAARRS